MLGNSIALYNPPIRVAEEFAMLDVISGGRLVAGFPVGTAMDTNYCYGEMPATLREKYREAHDLILRAGQNRMYSASTANSPNSVTSICGQSRYSSRIRQLDSGRRIGRNVGFCADHDYQYSFLSFFGYMAAKKVADGYWEVMAKKGKPLNPYSMAFAQGVAVARPMSRRNATSRRMRITSTIVVCISRRLSRTLLVTAR